MFTYDSIHAFPKAELHCHLDGSIRPRTLQKIAQVQQLPIEEDLELVAKRMQAAPTCKNLADYLVCFDYVLPYLQTKEALTLAAFDVMEQAYEDGVLYIEIRFAPSLSQEKGLSVADTILAVAQGIAQAEAQYGIYGNLLVCGMRNTPADEVQAIFEAALLQHHPKLAGFDLAGPEDEAFVRTFDEPLTLLIAERKVQLTLHAGECGCTQNIHQAMTKGATRIGHGISLKGDPIAQQQLADQPVCIEGCPTSNIQTQAITGYEAYPIREWLEAHVAFCLNTDNRTVSQTTLTNEYVQIAKTHGLTEAEFRMIQANGILYAFAADEIKATVLAKMKQASLKRI